MSQTNDSNPGRSAIEQVMADKIERYMDVMLADRIPEGLNNPIFKNHGGSIDMIDDSINTPGDVYATVSIDEPASLSVTRYFNDEGMTVEFTGSNLKNEDGEIVYNIWIRDTPSGRDFALNISMPLPS